MGNGIRVIEKPDWVSWEAVKDCIVAAHAVNREKGIRMSHTDWTADRIKESLGREGKMFVALDGEKIVGTAAVSVRERTSWYVQGRYAFMGFAGILPDYGGKGIYRELIRKREAYARELGLKLFLLDTHKDNKRVQQIAQINGYRYVGYSHANKDHYNVVMAKWPDGCPFSSFYCSYKYLVTKLKVVAYALIHK